MSDTILNDIRAAMIADPALSVLIAGRIYPDQATPGAAVPYIVYSEISLLSDQDLDGTTGDRTTRLQFDIYSATKAQAYAIREAQLALFDGYQGVLRAGAVQIQEVALANLRSSYEPDEKLYHYGLDLTFYYQI